MAKRPVVLVVDDDPSIVEFIDLALAEEGYAVVSASNGLLALDQLSRHRPDLVLLDLAMPEMGGEEFCRHLAADGGYDQPIVVMTASSRAREKAIELNAADWLGKPFELTHLIDCVDRHCGRGRAS